VKITKMYNIVYRGSKVYAEVDIEVTRRYGYLLRRYETATLTGLVVTGLFYKNNATDAVTYAWTCLEPGYPLSSFDIRKAFELTQAKELLNGT